MWHLAQLHVSRSLVCSLQIRQAGGSFLDAPCSGTKQPAEAGQLIFVCGGDRELYEQAAPLLDVMGKARFYYGPVRDLHCVLQQREHTCLTASSCRPGRATR